MWRAMHYFNAVYYLVSVCWLFGHSGHYHYIAVMFFHCLVGRRLPPMWNMYCTALVHVLGDVALRLITWGAIFSFLPPQSC